MSEIIAVNLIAVAHILSDSTPTIDVADEVLERWTQQPPIPGVEGILSRLRQPLIEEAKIPISQEEFDDFITGTGRFEEDRCTRDDVALLFRVSDTKYLNLLDAFISTLLIRLNVNPRS